MKCVVIGSGNVARQMTPALTKAGINVTQIYSRTPAHAETLASLVDGTAPISDISAIDADADLYVMAVSDDAIPPLVEQAAHAGLKFKPDAIWVHTAGSADIALLSPLGCAHGSIYPLMTFSRDREVDFSRVPLFVEGSDGETEKRLLAIAGRLSRMVDTCDSARRLRLHAAAVFACNFTNHLWTLATDLLTEGGYNFDVLAPLIGETLAKAQAIGAEAGQTGPAKRGDATTMATHMKILDDSKRTIYQTLSRSIADRHQK